jgi:hypothetical protein
MTRFTGVFLGCALFSLVIAKAVESERVRLALMPRQVAPGPWSTA